MYSPFDIGFNYFDVQYNQCIEALLPFGINDDYSFAVGKEFNLSPDDRINKGVIVGIQCVQSTEQTTFKTNNIRKDILSAAQLAGGYLVLCDDEGLEIAEFALTSLTRPSNNGKFFNTQIVGCNWGNSYVRFTNNPGGIGNSTGLKFNVFLA